VHAPPTGKKWYDSISSIPELQKECDAIARSTRTLRELPHDDIDVVSRARHLDVEERPTKRTRLDEDADNSSSLSSPVPFIITSPIYRKIQVIALKSSGSTRITAAGAKATSWNQYLLVIFGRLSGS
jgi:hypothetical protein